MFPYSKADHSLVLDIPLTCSDWVEMLSSGAVALLGLVLQASCFPNDGTINSTSVHGSSSTLSASAVLSSALDAMGGRDALSAVNGVAFNAYLSLNHTPLRPGF